MARGSKPEERRGGRQGGTPNKATVAKAAALASALTNKFSMDGVIGGAQIGYNWQNSRWVLGVETDIQGSGQRGNGSFFCPGGDPVGTTLAALNGACTPGHLATGLPFGDPNQPFEEPKFN